MNARTNTVLTTLLICFCWLAASGPVSAKGTSAPQQLALRQACSELGGRFEQSWIYNDQGVQWGRVMTCSTKAGFVRCQDGLCRGGRWVQPASTPIPGRRPDNLAGADQFPAEPAAFSAALTRLSKD